MCCNGFKILFIPGFPGGSVVRNRPDSAGDAGSIPDPGRPHTPRTQQVQASEVLSLCYKAGEPQPPKPELRRVPPCSATGEATAVRSPCSPQLGPHSHEDSTLPKTNKYLKKKNFCSKKTCFSFHLKLHETEWLSGSTFQMKWPVF